MMNNILSTFDNIVIVNLVQSVPLLFISLSLIMGLVLLKKQFNPILGRALARKILRYDRIGLLFIVNWLIILSHLFLYDWFINIGNLSNVVNYITAFFLFSILSLTFGVLAYLIYLYDETAYHLQNDTLNKKVDPDNRNFPSLVGELKEIIPRLQEVIIELNRHSTITRISTESDIKKNRFQFIRKKEKTLYRIGGSELIVVCEKFIRFNFILDIKFLLVYNGQNTFILESSDSFSEKKSDGYLTFLKVKELSNNLLNTVYKVIEVEEQLYSRSFVTFDAFLYFYLTQMLGVSQNFIMPKSHLSRLLHVVSGIYKFLFLGAFLSIVIQSAK